MKNLRRLFYVAFLIFSLGGSVIAQNSKYLIEFTDKHNSPFSLGRPTEFLSQRSIDRRIRQNIPLTNRDLPVNAAYVKAVRELGAHVWYTSRWMNAVLVETDEPTLAKISKLPFVKSPAGPRVAGARFKNTGGTGTNQEYSNIDDKQWGITPADYGNALTQVAMLGADKMHEEGFTGKGLQIAVLDGGFRNADKLPFFTHLFTEKRILGTYDFVQNERSVYEDDSHGMQALSAIAAYQPGVMIGTGYDASFWLLRTEAGGSESRVEEVNWLIGAEFADSVGADILHSSLGYNTFDDPTTNYRQSDMDGNTAISTKAADFAASVGILVVVSAGNEANDAWKKITAPADADSALAVGAVDRNGQWARFSSLGPSADQRVKPDVAAQGQGTTLGRTDGSVGTSNGTSFSAPLLSGLAAGFWQAFPQLTNMEVISYLQRSASQASKPDSLLGYGIPDFSRAFALAQEENNTKIGYLSPNPVLDGSITIQVNNRFLTKPLEVEVFDLKGRSLAKYSVKQTLRENHFPLLAPRLRSGLYLLRLTSEGQQQTLRLVKE